MLCLSIFILLQSSLTYSSVTKTHVTYYWKTTEEIDKVYDYWNHGPIHIPGLQDIFTVTTENLDKFPPWLTKSTKTQGYATPASANPITTTTTTTTTVESSDESEIIEETTTDKTTAKTKPIATTITITTQRKPPKIKIIESEEDGTTEPFSVFLRKLFRNLSVKSLPELPALVEPFLTYLEELANDQLKFYIPGDVIIPFIKKFAQDTRKIITPSAPEALHAKVYQVYTALANRSTALNANVLNTLDDTFDEAEEEFMQNTLHDVKLFPDSNKTGQEIAHGHKESYYSKRKYESLKRKYKRLKEILAAQRGNYRSGPNKIKKHIDINVKNADMKLIHPKNSDISKKPAAEINDSSFKFKIETTTPTVKENLRFKRINLFLDDYDTKDEINKESYTIRNKGSYRKAFPLNTVVVFESNDSKDAEKELKENIHDTIRHMEFDNNNVSRSYHDDNTSTVRIIESPETDVEAVLKSNIYKAVKKMLKK
ncbi:uncharacterized protein LOC134677656 [Cydia fagiglandana]|uniref:uncharacterized protein LOC134677656 n=1 Tax=Cydia fagiglandana TaxID=1458189 RepID=UPI002FEE0FCA